MALNNHRSVKADVQLLTKVRDPLRLVLPSAIGEKDERYAVALKQRKSVMGARNGVRRAYKDAVYARTSLELIMRRLIRMTNSKANAKSGSSGCDAVV